MPSRTTVALTLLAALFLLACGPSEKESKALAKAKAAQEMKDLQAKIEASRKQPPIPAVLVSGPKGLKYADVKTGTGKEIVKGGTATVAFWGWVDGTLIDSSEDRGKPHSFLVGQGSVIEGWDLGVVGMKEGGVRLLVIPPNLAYGAEGRPGFVGRNKTLIYKIQLLKAYDPY
jgi:FKBP-type peptidyl-prolyl cis-trans isomerase